MAVNKSVVDANYRPANGDLAVEAVLSPPAIDSTTANLGRRGPKGDKGDPGEINVVPVDYDDWSPSTQTLPDTLYLRLEP
jgi:hypothetical protein